MGQRFSSILIVDDSKLIRTMICDALESGGYFLSEAHNGQQAIALAKTNSPDLILLDLEMPQMDGLECLRELQKQEATKDIPVIIVTSSHAGKKIDEVLEAGAIDYIAKPFTETMLQTRVKDIAHRHNRESELNSTKSSLEATVSELEILTRSDPLTGVYNRRAFFDECQKEWSRAVRHKIPLSCVVIDIDFFKRVNDNHGHLFGDKVLKEVAQVLASGTRVSDVLCRSGGEEFMVILPETNEQKACQWAEKIRADVESLILTLDGVRVPVTISLGVAERLLDTDAPEVLIDLADQAMAIAKQRGRNQVSMHSSSLTGFSMDVTGLAQSLAGKCARDIMFDAVLTLDEDDLFSNAETTLFEFQSESIPVINSEGKLVGVLTERRALEALQGTQNEEKTVKQIMIEGVVSFDIDTPAEEVLSFLQRVSMNRIIVTCESQPVGIVTRRSFVQWFHNWLNIKDGCMSGSGSKAVAVGAKEMIREAAKKIELRMERLEAGLENDSTDYTSLVMHEVTQVQELVSTLLARLQSENMATTV